MSKGTNGKKVVWFVLAVVVLAAGFTRIMQGVYNKQRAEIAARIEAEKAAAEKEAAESADSATETEATPER